MREQSRGYESLFPSLGLEDERRFISTLRGWGMNEAEVEILSSRFLYGDTYTEISQAMGGARGGITAKRAVERVLVKLKALLKE